MTTNQAAIPSKTTLHDSEADAAIGLRAGGSRYFYDLALLPRGWKQYDTTQDASYFGVWIHQQKMEVMTYAEGDRSLVQCQTLEAFKAELAEMEKFYGPVPPAFVGIDPAAGTVTDYIVERPTAQAA